MVAAALRHHRADRVGEVGAGATARRGGGGRDRRDGISALHARLAATDPEAAARIDARDLRRIVRALEVHELTGTPISAHQRAHDYKTFPLRHAARIIGLAPPRAELVARIEARV